MILVVVTMTIRVATAYLEGGVSSMRGKGQQVVPSIPSNEILPVIGHSGRRLGVNDHGKKMLVD